MQKYKVFRRYRMEAEDEQSGFCGPWEFVGETRAVSVSKAINNVRFREMGDIIQLKPLATSGHWETWYEWRAEEAE